LLGRKTNIYSAALDGISGGSPSLLFHPPQTSKYDNQWVLLPRGGSWNKVHSWFLCLLSNEECSAEKFLDEK
jgi:hypothetical protein